MTIKQALYESLFVRTSGHRHEIHTEKRNQYADDKMNKKNKKSAPKVQKDDIHIKAYKKAVKNDSQYSIWINNTVGEI